MRKRRAPGSRLSSWPQPRRCRRRVAEIDYGGEHRAYNEADSDIGTLKLTFTGEDRAGEPVVEWRYAKPGDTFKRYDVEIHQSDIDRS